MIKLWLWSPDVICCQSLKKVINGHDHNTFLACSCNVSIRPEDLLVGLGSTIIMSQNGTDRQNDTLTDRQIDR
jgi:hypothetical protein